MFGIVIHRLQVIKRRGRIAQLSDALIILPLAASDAAKVKPQDSEAHVVKSIVKIINNLVVHCAPKLWVGMQYDGNRGISVFLRVISPFKATIWTGKYNLGHIIFSPQKRYGAFLTAGSSQFRMILSFAKIAVV